jgi:hypothetical protein
MKITTIALIMLVFTVTTLKAQEAKYYLGRGKDHLKFIGTWMAKLDDKNIKIRIEYKLHDYIPAVDAYMDHLIGYYSIFDKNNKLIVGDTVNNTFPTAVVFPDDPNTLEASYLDKKINLHGRGIFIYDDKAKTLTLTLMKTERHFIGTASMEAKAWREKKFLIPSGIQLYKQGVD